jgi:hypothetical protein
VSWTTTNSHIQEIWVSRRLSDSEVGGVDHKIIHQPCPLVYPVAHSSHPVDIMWIE